MITHTWNLENDTRELIYLKKKIDSQTQKPKLWLTRWKREGKLGVWDEQIHATIYKIDKQKGPTV